MECKQLYKELWGRFVGRYKVWVAEDEKDKLGKEYKQRSMKEANPKAKMVVIIKSTV